MGVCVICFRYVLHLLSYSISKSSTVVQICRFKVRSAAFLAQANTAQHRKPVGWVTVAYPMLCIASTRMTGLSGQSDHALSVPCPCPIMYVVWVACVLSLAGQVQSPRRKEWRMRGVPLTTIPTHMEWPGTRRAEAPCSPWCSAQMLQHARKGAFEWARWTECCKYALGHLVPACTGSSRLVPAQPACTGPLHRLW